MTKKIASKVLISALLLTFISFVSLSGESQDNLKQRIERVKSLYLSDMYNSAEAEIENILSTYNLSEIESAELEAYKVLCAIKLKHPACASLLAEFEANYPYAPQKDRVRFQYASYLFNKQEYNRSYAILEQIKEENLYRNERVEFRFNRAYCNMQAGRADKAIEGFTSVIYSGDSPFKPSSQYYLGYIYYLSKDFKRAIGMLKELLDNHTYSALARYYTLESKFMLKEYDYVVNHGEKLYFEIEGEYKAKTARMLSEAFYDKNQINKAKEYLELYSKSGKEMSRKDTYYYGLVSYSMNSYLSAIDAFNKVIGVSDTLGQSALYHLGNSYLMAKNKHNALRSFERASKMYYDDVIRESASFLYSKLSFDVNNDISAFNNYIKQYPSSERSDEIYYYIATSYLQDRNYKQAISALDKIKVRTSSMTVNLQKASFFRAMQLMDIGSYRGAIEDFETSIENGRYNRNLTLLAKFWMAEAYYRTDYFDESIKINTTLIADSDFKRSDEYPLALFNLGYGYLKKEYYEDAAGWFKEFVSRSHSNMNYILEAKTRLADCYFMLKDYSAASQLYEDIASKSYYSEDYYASYMGAISYGLLSQPNKKISMLEEITENNRRNALYPKAMYELGRTWYQVDNPENAIECFNILLKNQSDSIYYSKSLLELGMIYSNLGNYDKALGYFGKIVENKPFSEDAQSAMAGIESIYQMQNRAEEYLAYLDRIGLSSIKSADEKEMMLFDSAEQIFLSGNYNEALASLNSFLKRYPDGAKSAQAYFYLGETQNRLGKPELAADAYLKVMERGEGSFAELSTLYYARINYDLQKYDRAIEAYMSLSEIAQLDNNKYEALVGKMNSYYHNGDFVDATVQATAVLASDKTDEQIAGEATYILAKSYLTMGKRAEALPLLRKLSKNSVTPEGAECAYLLILDAYDEGDFAEVEKRVYALSDSGTPQNYWLAKSFIVLGDSFAERQEWEQASATFNSIKEGYTPQGNHDDVLEQVEMRLNRIEKQ